MSRDQFERLPDGFVASSESYRAAVTASTGAVGSTITQSARMVGRTNRARTTWRMTNLATGARRPPANPYTTSTLLTSGRTRTAEPLRQAWPINVSVSGTRGEGIARLDVDNLSQQSVGDASMPPESLTAMDAAFALSLTMMRTRSLRCLSVKPTSSPTKNSSRWARGERRA